MMFQTYNCCLSTTVASVFLLCIYGTKASEKASLSHRNCSFVSVRILTVIPWLPFLLVKLLKNLPCSLDPNKVITIVTFTLNIFMKHDSKITSVETLESVLHTVSHLCLPCVVGADSEGIRYHPIPAELYPCSGVTVG